jgi:hypothetical protein
VSDDKDKGARAGAKPPSGSAALFALAGLAAGAVAGWFGHGARAEANLKADTSAPAASASTSLKTDSCATLEKDVCSTAGDTSAACGYAKGATILLTPDLCAAARDSVPAMIEKVKVARRACDDLVARVCRELGPESGGCTVARQRGAAFGPARCAELTTRYESVVGELRQMEQRGMIPGPTANPSAPVPKDPAPAKSR